MSTVRGKPIRALTPLHSIIMISSVSAICSGSRFALASSEHVPRRAAGSVTSFILHPRSIFLQLEQACPVAKPKNHDTATIRRPASFRVVASPFRPCLPVSVESLENLHGTWVQFPPPLNPPHCHLLRTLMCSVPLCLDHSYSQRLCPRGRKTK